MGRSRCDHWTTPRTTLKAERHGPPVHTARHAGRRLPPAPHPAEGAPTLALDVACSQELIAKTHFSISTDETRAHLNSALFEWDGDVVRMVTTDGHRLSKMEVKVAGRQASATMLIPLKAMQELRRLCDEALAESAEGGGKDAPKPQLQITQSGSRAFFQGAGMTFSVKLVDAQFPPYAQVIPQNASKKVRVPSAAFADALASRVHRGERADGGREARPRSRGQCVSRASPLRAGDGFDESAHRV